MDKYTYLLTFAREGTLAWLGHLDLMVVFERSLRRAGLPLVWSQGYNPRPSLVFALPLGLGVECRRDLLEIETTEKLLPQDIMQDLNAKLPRGLTIVEVRVSPDHQKSLMALVQAAAYRLEGPGLGQTFAQLAQKPESVEIIREHKGKQRSLQLFSYLYQWQVIDENSFMYCCKAGSSENLRPDLMLKALAEFKPELAPACWGSRIIREALYLKGFPRDLAGPFRDLYNNLEFAGKG